MKHIFPFISITFSFYLFLVVPTTALAITTTSISKGFGGRVYMAPIPGITCNGLGRLMLLNTNARSALSTLGSRGGLSKNEANSFASGIYGSIPTYATDPSKTPTQGGQILGKQNALPDMNTCYIPTPSGPVYIPVLKTTPNYKTSFR